MKRAIREHRLDADAFRNGKIKFSVERRYKHGATWRGKKRPKETRAKISATLRGHTVSVETRRKIAASLRARRRS